jgi:hypothetical protein
VTTAWPGSWWRFRGPPRERLAFKGGTALKRCYFPDYRFSEDLDFTLVADVPFEVIRQELEPVFEEAHHLAGVRIWFAHEDRDKHANSYTFYLGYELVCSWPQLPGTFHTGPRLKPLDDLFVLDGGVDPHHSPEGCKDPGEATVMPANSIIQ